MCFVSSLDVQRNALRVLNAAQGFSNRKIIKLIEHYGNAAAIFQAEANEISFLAGVPLAAALNLKHFPADAFLKKDDDALRTSGARVVTWLDEDYPVLLKTISDAPVSFYIRGDFPLLNVPLLAVVGARHASLYGLETAGRLSAKLAERGCAVVSGMAQGIDAAAHYGVLKAGGKTVGVLGCGLDVVYPHCNKTLFEQMERKGCLISEFPFGTQPSRYSFPRRNRIVSGLSLGTIVIEASIRSGALITAAFALEQGREVFAVPGRIDSHLSAGPLALIRQGAKIVSSVEDILEELPVRRDRAVSVKRTGETPLVLKELDEQERKIFDILSEGLFSFEDLQIKSGLPMALLMRPLLTLQIKRLIREKPGKCYELLEPAQ